MSTQRPDGPAGREQVPYYARYDDHYRALYGKGIKYWSDSPDHCRANAETIVSRVLQARPDPRGATLIEMGCGEGHLIAPLVELGVLYTGLDYSPSAIAKARQRVQELGLNADLRAMDVLRLDDEVSRRRYDLILDQACLHMLVVDDDRRRYLSNVRALMKGDSVFLLLGQARDDDAFAGEIRSIDEYERVFQHDLSRPKAWEAWDGQAWVAVQLPSFACRPRSLNGYLEELTEAGFLVTRTYESRPETEQQSLGFMLGARGDSRVLPMGTD